MTKQSIAHGTSVPRAVVRGWPLFPVAGNREMSPRAGIIIRAALLLLLGSAWSGCAALGSVAHPRLTSSEKMMWSTYAIATPKGMATCVVVNRKDPSAPHGIVPVLITSAHVLSVAPRGPFFLVIRSPRVDRSPQIAVLEFQSTDPTGRPFVQHPRHDVAALELRIPPELANDVSLLSYIDEDAIALQRDEPHAGDEISVLGFPRVFPGTEGAFPILRNGKIASYSAGPPADREKFLVNSNVYGGDSGGPVFSGRRGGRPKLVGILTERIGKKDAGIPLAVAVDAAVIRETLGLQAARGRWYLGGGSGPSSVSGKQPHPHRVQLVGPPKSFSEVLHAKLPGGFPLPVLPQN
jgi:hypothetical protein